MIRNNITQIRFYSKNDLRNTHSYQLLKDGCYLTTAAINKCEIRTIPGTKITLIFNNINIDEEEQENVKTITVGDSGVYCLEYNLVYLQAFQIDENSLNIINDSDFGYFIMTIS